MGSAGNKALRIVHILAHDKVAVMFGCINKINSMNGVCRYCALRIAGGCFVVTCCLFGNRVCGTCGDAADHHSLTGSERNRDLIAVNRGNAGKNISVGIGNERVRDCLTQRHLKGKRGRRIGICIRLGHSLGQRNALSRRNGKRAVVSKE